MSMTPNQHPLFILTKDQDKKFNPYAEKACKILKFTPDWTLDEILKKLSEIDTKIFPLLFIFVIGHENFELSVENGDEKRQKLDIDGIKKILRNFQRNHSIYIHLSSTNGSKFYSRHERSDFFNEMELEDFVTEIDDYSLSYMVKNEKKPEKIEEEIYENIIRAIFKSSILIQNFKVTKSSKIFRNEYEGKQFESLRTMKAEDEYKPSTSTQNLPNIQNVQTKTKSSHLDVKIPEKTLNIIKSHKFALISKNINSNQSWIINNMTKQLKELNPGMLTYCVGLRKLQEKVEAENCEIDFMELVADHIATKNSKLEAEIFKKLYKNGKVCILIAEFEESDPNCAEFLASFCKSFEINLGNQLWMAVKDHFEGNSGDQLGFEVVFHLNNPKNIKPEIAEHKSSIFQRTLRNSIDKNFDTSEVLNILNMNDSKIENLIFINFISTLELTEELTIEKVPKVLDNSDLIKTFENMSEDSETILHILVKNREFDNFRSILNNLQALAASKEIFKKFLNHRTTENHENFLHVAAKSCHKEDHFDILKLLSNIFDDRQELLNFIMQKNKLKNNFIHLITLQENVQLFENTLGYLKSILNFDQFQDILNSKGQFGRNLLQLATIVSRNVQTCETFWNLFEEFRGAYDQFLQFITEVDENGQNIFHLAAGHSRFEIFKFTIDEPLKRMPFERIKNILRKNDTDDRNILQIAAKQDLSLQFHQEFFKFIKSSFDSVEFWDMLKHTDVYGDNVLCIAIQFNTSGVIELIWIEIKTFLVRHDIKFEISGSNEVSEKNWIQMALERNPAVFEICEEMQKEHEAKKYSFRISDDMDIIEIIE